MTLLAVAVGIAVFIKINRGAKGFHDSNEFQSGTARNTYFLCQLLAVAGGFALNQPVDGLKAINEVPGHSLALLRITDIGQ